MAKEKRRLVDLDRVIERLKKAETVMCRINGIKCVEIGGMLNFMETQPTVDAVEVVHGHWCWEGRFKACSNCGSYVEWDETLGANFWKFCPYCGAKMDRGNDDV